ncbi:MAG: uroporphyrinogen-III C-methyltransferase [Gemmatimonadetes bacterium]|nr:uroporphyrinogen-III C-methyltransferase [Gemmatimonadota bacterium]NNM04416.1 uroporphyrinogen-III C-methyltransferase [Gemmatimonadota bacterium]
MTTSEKPTPGTVHLVGAGPGDPGLITVRAVQCLKEADLVLYDYLANPTLVEYASPGAELVRLGRHDQGRSLTPDEISEIMVEAALEGRTVVRLKGGDASIFARGIDEAGACRAAGVAFEIVPGITSGLATAAYAEIPLTHHEDASAVALVTGHERDDKEESHLDYQALAAFPGTLVFYMGVKWAGRWSGALLEHGKPPDTPVAVVQWCSRARQQTVKCTLDTVVDVIGEKGIRPPSLFVVGRVVDHAPTLSWFQERPLFGTSVLVAGSRQTASNLRGKLSVLGAEVLTQPAIRIVEPEDWEPADAVLEKVGEYDWIVFTSGNGVDGFMNRILHSGRDARALGGARIAALGKGTAERLRNYHLFPDLAPDKVDPSALAQDLMDSARDGAFLMARAAGDRPVLAEELEELGAGVDQVPVYRTVDVDEPNQDVADALKAGEIHWITVTSSPTARSLVRLYGEALRSAKIVSISPLTTATLKELGYDPVFEARPHTVDGMVSALVEHGGQAD